jgi:predicted nucleic acid-binding protein
MVRIYLDACTLNRLLDDQRQPRIRREAEAVEEIFGLIQSGRASWIAGAVLEAEIMQTPDTQRRGDILALLRFADQLPHLSSRALVRATTLEQFGYGALDALHLAVAEESGADVLLTTDDRFLRQAHRGLGNPAILVMNPVNWLQGRKP